MKTKLFVFGLLLLAIITGCTETNTSTDNSDNSTTTTTINNAPKTKEELEAELAKEVINGVQEAIENKQEKNKEFDENRAKEWVLQIGEPITNQKTMISQFKKYKHIPNICVFKDGGSYLIIKKDNQPFEVLQDSLGSIKSKVGTDVEIIDIMGKCPRRKTITQDSPISNKENMNIECYVCDR